MVSLEVLVATMNQKDHALLEKMNIRSDAIIANQTDFNSVEDFDYFGNKIKYLNFKEKGVGLNRNNAIMRSTADICVLADDDMVFFDNYVELVMEAYQKYPDADVIIFNILQEGVKRRLNTKKVKINFFNYMCYGAARITFKREFASYNGIYFNQNFGGGAKHSSGEDTLFLSELLHKKAKIIAVPVSLAEIIDTRGSSWFNGYNEDFFFDKGILLKLCHPILAFPFALFLCLKHKEFRSEFSFLKIFKFMCNGIAFVKHNHYCNNGFQK